MTDAERAMRARWAAEDAAYWAKRRTADAALQAKWNADFMARRANRAEVRLTLDGQCPYCFCLTDDSREFCSAECRKAYQFGE